MSKNKSYVVGQTVTLRAEFKVDNVLTNATSVTLDVKKPISGTTTNPVVTNASTGVYTATVTVDEVGYWNYRWEGTGTAAGVQEGTFYIHDSAL